MIPISNSTELDELQYLQQEGVELPDLYFNHERECLDRDGTLLAKSDYIAHKPGERSGKRRIRFRTIGDMTCAGEVASEASTIEAIVAELETSRVSERGGRADDRVSAAAIEDRKREGYF